MCSYFAYYLFFFSSRRRHATFSRDWSSDVCSSDLTSPSPPTLTRSVNSDVTKRIRWASGGVDRVSDKGVSVDAACLNDSSGRTAAAFPIPSSKPCRLQLDNV